MTTSLKDRAINSMLWVTIDKTGGYFLLFVSNLVLARLLMPDDFGCIAMLHVFIALADIIVHGGFGSALIQKKKPSHIDYTSVFYINLAISIVLYGLLFFLAPSISRFYAMPLLTKVLRVQAVILIINSFTVVQLSILKKNLRFRAIAIRNILSSFLGLTVGIICAFFGMGVWSLVINSIITQLIGVLLLWKVSDWKPTWEFSFQSVRELFGFGGFMMLSSIIGTIYNELQSLLVGKFYSAADLGYVNQAKKLEGVPSGALSSVVSQVSFPVFSKLQDNVEALKYGLKKNIKSVQYVNLPMMLLLMVIAEPLIELLYGERWMASIPYFQILCVSRLFGVLVPLNMSIIGAKGKGKLYLITQLIKCGFSIIIISLSVRHGIFALLIALALIPLFEFMVCSMVNHKLIHYGLFHQLGDILPTLGIALLLAALTYGIKYVIPWNLYLIMIIQVFLYIVFYLGITKILKFEAFDVYYDVLKKRLKGKYKLKK
jgi:O-antigen/teichoic acid export membrane protein